MTLKKRLNKISWDKFVKLMRSFKKEGKYVELSMQRNYYLRFPEIDKDEIIIEQQHIVKRSDERRIKRNLKNPDLSLWWLREVRDEIFQARLKDRDGSKSGNRESKKTLEKKITKRIKKSKLRGNNTKRRTSS